jgi:sialate O-acetylesterase
MGLPLSRVATVLLLALGLCGLSPSSVRADVRLPKLIGDNLVLQQGKPLPIWGWADPGEKVSVTFAGKTEVATADEKGKWMVKLPAQSANSQPRELSVAGKNTIVLKNVLVGEVWIGSGQSNMEWSVAASANPQEEIQNGTYPEIRLFTVPKKRAGAEPQEDVVGQWSECTPDTVKGFSAVLYFFGRDLHKQLKVPVGLIHTSWGGTPAEHWMPNSAFAADASLKQTSDHPHAQNVMKEPGTLYNGMVAPLVPYAIQGVIWYQGESNVPMAKEYRKLFPAMIQGWRKEWNQGDFPFLYVQIAPWVYSNIPTWPRSGCPLVREAQLKTLSLPKTGMAVTMDIGDVNDIHPKNKQEVGRRLAHCARAQAYGEDLVYSGPLFKSMKVDGSKIVLSFDHLGGGLAQQGDKLRTFQIAGKDQQFVDATAEIVGETVVVHSPQVAEPVAVRYAWQDDALPNLMNRAGLPASPFRTDNF